MKVRHLLIILLALGLSLVTNAQDLGKEQPDRIEILKRKLETLSKQSKGLNEEVDFSVTGITIQEFLRGLAESNELNISVDPTINVRVYNNFNNVEAKDILLFLCKEYDLDIRFVGSIMSFYSYRAPLQLPEPVKPKEIDIQYLEIYFDAPITLAKKFSLRGIPTTILFNKKGEEFGRIMGSIDFNNLEFINWLKQYD